MTDKSVIIIADETPKGFSDDKGTMLIGDKPLIKHVFDSVHSIVDEVIIVTTTQEQTDLYAKLLPKTVKFTINDQLAQNPLSGAIAGFEVAQGKYALVLPFDSPFVDKQLAMFLLDVAVGKTAAVPRTPDNEVEPLCSVYQISMVMETAKQVAAEGIADMQTLVENLRGVRYISTTVIEQMDPELRSFFSINTLLDLKRAAVMLQGKPKRTKQQRKK